MNTILIIVLLIIVGLIILFPKRILKVGKNIANNILCFLENKSKNPVNRVQRIVKELEEKLTKLIDSAGNLKAEETRQINECDKVKTKAKEAGANAKKFKDEDNKEKAIHYLQIKKRYDIQVERITSSINNIVIKRLDIEKIVDKTKVEIIDMRARLKTMKAMSSANEVIELVNGIENGSTRLEILEETESEVQFTNDKVNHITQITSNESEDLDDDVEVAYNEL